MKDLNWKVATKTLLDEIGQNKQIKAAKTPLKIMFDILRVAAKRALELEDKEMISIMWMLTMYDESDRGSEMFDEGADERFRDIYDEYIKRISKY